MIIHRSVFCLVPLLKNFVKQNQKESQRKRADKRQRKFLKQSPDDTSQKQACSPVLRVGIRLLQPSEAIFLPGNLVS